MGEAINVVEESGFDTTLVLKVGYRGAGFSGYAEQEGQRTVAGELRRALETLYRRPVVLSCAGRTDAGVSAVSQYVSLPVSSEELVARGVHKLWRALAALTPEDISIRGLYQAQDGFSARFDALWRRYRYRIMAGNVQPVLCADHVWWHRGVLDVCAMDEAARLLVGEHDFRSFCKQSSAELLVREGRSTSRNIMELSVNEVTEGGEELIAIDVRGNAFLHNMVRIIVGTLAEIGSSRHPVSWMEEVLYAQCRQAAGQTAPACGLVFEDVGYEAGVLTPLVE